MGWGEEVKPVDATRGLNADATLDQLHRAGREPVAFWTPADGALVEAWTGESVRYRVVWKGDTIALAAQRALQEERT